MRAARQAAFVVAIAIVGLSFFFLVSSLRGIGADEIARALLGISPRKGTISAILTGASFLALGTYDVVAVSVVAPHKMSPVRAWFAGAAANAIANTLGFHVLTATAVRYRILSRSGLCALGVAGVTALSLSALAFGFASLFSLAAIISPAESPWQRAGGLALFCVLLLFARWLGNGKTVTIRSRALILPPSRVALAQMGLGAVEMGAAIGALYVLMPDRAVIAFPGFVALYIGAVLLGIASHTPGGLGVFEATMLTLAQEGDRAAVLAALLLYRMIYNLCPFALAVAALAGEEIRAAISSRADSV